MIGAEEDLAAKHAAETNNGEACSSFIDGGHTGAMATGAVQDIARSIGTPIGDLGYRTMGDAIDLALFD